MSVSWGTQYSKLKTNLRLAANRLRLMQKKKTEQAIKARSEVALFLSNDKEDRARIRVESIIREDFIVEAYELLEMYCELLLARFGLIQQMKELDDGIAEAVSSLLWVAPRISHEISEFKVINDQLQQKYGKQFAEAARMNQLPEPSCVSQKLIQKLSVSTPSKILVEKYLIEIARSANIDFTPNAKVMRDDDDEIAAAERNLINFMNEKEVGWSGVQKNESNPNVFSNNFNYNVPPNDNPNDSSINYMVGPPPQYTPINPPKSNIYPQSNPPNNMQNNTFVDYPANDMQNNTFVDYPPTSVDIPATVKNENKDSNVAVKNPTNSQNTIAPVTLKDFPLEFPEPPTNLPYNAKTNNNKNSNTNNSNSDLNFDDLAKRFDELKKDF